MHQCLGGHDEGLNSVTIEVDQRDIPRLLIVGAVAVVRWGALKRAPEGSWLARMLGRKQKMLVAVALANRMVKTLASA